MAEHDDDLVVDLSGPQWQALLTVAPPGHEPPKTVDFDVPPTGGGQELRRIGTQVVFTTARNERSGWPAWHVKIYTCASLGDAETLRQYLNAQASALQRANTYLPGAARRTPIEPPWAVVPVQVVRGDGRLEQLSGAVTTRLGVPSDQIVAQLESRLPRWIGGARPDLVLLAVSPQIEALPWEPLRHWPGTEHLADFAQLAAGIDQLHQLRWAHCDIKPENVCWCAHQDGSGYVLIDTDAATQADPPPRALRGTALYEYTGLRALRLDDPEGLRHLTPGLLYAQDRFGFLTVVLSALAGRHWVDHTLLGPDPDDPSRRVADSAEAVRHALRAHWPDPRWAPLADALAHPFGPDGRIALEAPGPWAETWLSGVRDAERRCADGDPGDGPWPDESLVHTFARDLERIRDHALRGPATRPERVHLAYRAIGEAAQEIALRRAALWMSVSGLGIVLAALVLAAAAFVIGE
ncbi:hypothetical protein [Symbioplanes lichenis]|uniref:hypothetical protein n=1 Tax=Symbioplanes lichenis TaxID=1629072 RepID=UPI002739C872|nr:hypothetical protein [Actinoplanes lichenis]